MDIVGPASPHFARWLEWGNRLGRIEEESSRLKRTLGVSGPLTLEDRVAASKAANQDDMPVTRWESLDQRFSNAAHDRVVRSALLKLATASIDLSGFATWREPRT